MKCTFHAVTWEQYFNIVIRERMYDEIKVVDNETTKVEEFTVLKGYGKYEANYERAFVVVEELENPVAQFKKMMLEQLDLRGCPKTIGSKDHALEVTLQESVLQALENCSALDNCVLIKNDDAKDGQPNYIFAPTTRDELIIKMLGPVMGCLIIYQPKKFSRVYID